MAHNEDIDYWDRLVRASSGSLMDTAVRENIRRIAADGNAPQNVRLAAAGMLPREEAEVCAAAA
jgi:hypothetical protein